MTCYRSKLLIAFVAISCFACEARAAPDITQAVSTDCRWDYHNFCSEYGIGKPPSELLLSQQRRQTVQGMRERLDCSGRRFESLRAAAPETRPLRSACEMSAYGPFQGR